MPMVENSWAHCVLLWYILFMNEDGKVID